MRVLLDANIFLSYLLAPDTQRTITAIVHRCFEAGMELLVPEELLGEIVQAVGAKKYLRERIMPATVEGLVDLVRESGMIPERLDKIAGFSIDPDDDYLVAYGLAYGVDYLVTGDPHLLRFVQVAQLRIVEPRAFLELFEAGES